MQKKIVIFIFASLLSISAFAQDDFTIGHLQNLRDADIYYKGVNTVFRPTTGVENPIFDTLIFPKNDKVDKNWFVRKLFHEHLFIIGNEKYKMYIDPVFDFRYNRLPNLNTGEHIGGYTNTRGFFVQAKLGENVFFNSSFYENQAVLPAYYENLYDVKGNIPGYARVKKLSKFSEFDYANAYGNISFRPIKCLNFTLGYDRLFVGDGYNSVILSDFSAPMPYIKTSFKFGKWEYVNLVTKLTQFAGNVENADKINKIATYNFLIFNPQNDWQFTFFEQSVIDYKNRNFAEGLVRGIPIVREFIWTTNDDNIKLGTNISYGNSKIGIFYSQAVFSAVKQIVNNQDSTNIIQTYQCNVDLQLGYKNHNLFNVKGLFFLAEANLSGCWTNGEKSEIIDLRYNYYSLNILNSNYGQSLTLPQNKGAYLFTAILSYSIKQFKIMAKYNLSPRNSSIETNDANSYPDSYIYPRDIVDFQFVYEMNSANRMQWFAGISLFDTQNGFNDYYISAGFRTALRNNY